MSRGSVSETVVAEPSAESRSQPLAMTKRLVDGIQECLMEMTRTLLKLVF